MGDNVLRLGSRRSCGAGGGGFGNFVRGVGWGEGSWVGRMEWEVDVDFGT